MALWGLVALDLGIGLAIQGLNSVLASRITLVVMVSVLTSWVGSLGMASLAAEHPFRAARLWASSRDGLFRLLGALLALLAALAAADATEVASRDSLFNSALEGLAPGAGVFAGLTVFAVLGVGLFALPKQFTRAQLNGRITSRAVGEALWFGVMVFLAAVVSVTSDRILQMQLLAFPIMLAAFAGFVLARVGLGAARVREAVPLWIVLPQPLGSYRGRPRIEELAVVLAGVWRDGPVTLFAVPEAAPSIRGTHLRMVAQVG